MACSAATWASRVSTRACRACGGAAPAAAEVVAALDDALELARERGRNMPGADEICILGGGEVYRQALPLADRLYVTHVLASVGGDTRFPAIDPAEWELVHSEDHPAGEKDSHATRYAVYDRRRTMH